MVEMIDDCEGCEEDFNQALLYEEDGLHIATIFYYGKLYSLDDDDHLYLLMVDENGKIVVH